MIERIAHRDLRNRSAEILREVAAGRTFEITNHGQVVAVLSPATAPPDVRIRPPRVHAPFAELPKYVVDENTADVLDELRGDR